MEPTQKTNGPDSKRTFRNPPRWRKEDERCINGRGWLSFNGSIYHPRPQVGLNLKPASVGGEKVPPALKMRWDSSSRIKNDLASWSEIVEFLDILAAPTTPPSRVAD